MSKTGDQPKLFITSPFSLTASSESSACWAGRREIHGRLERICNSFLKRADSSLDMIWANLGSGKSHALFRIKYLLEHLPKYGGNVIPVFVEMPEQLSHFLDLYRRIIRVVPLPLASANINGCSLPQLNSNLLRAASAFQHGSPFEHSLAKQWLLGERPNLRDLKRGVGIDTRIEDDSTACDVLSGIIEAVSDCGSRLLILLDEFQRVALLKERQRNTTLSHLRSVFSRNPSGFSMVLAVGSRLEKTATELVSQDLRTLMGMRPSVSLPEMSKEEAREFVLERLKFFRPPVYTGTAEAPFGTSAINEVLSSIEAKGTAKLIPRTILQVLAYVYDEYPINGDALGMNVQTVRKLLDELRWDV